MKETKKITLTNFAALQRTGTTNVIFIKGTKDTVDGNPRFREVIQFYLPSGTYIGELDASEAEHFERDAALVIGDLRIVNNY